MTEQMDEVPDNGQGKQQYNQQPENGLEPVFIRAVSDWHNLTGS